MTHHQTPQPSCRGAKTTVIATARLMLRAPRRADAEPMAKLLNDRRIAENLTRIPHPYGVDDALLFIDNANLKVDEASFLITLADGTIIGGCGIRILDRSDPEPGYWIGVPYWGNGYATEAARAIVDHAFGDLGFTTLRGSARVSNLASRRVLEKCGFEWTGVSLLRVRALASSVPVDCFRLERRRWASLQGQGEAQRVA